MTTSGPNLSKTGVAQNLEEALKIAEKECESWDTESIDNEPVSLRSFKIIKE